MKTAQFKITFRDETSIYMTILNCIGNAGAWITAMSRLGNDRLDDVKSIECTKFCSE